MNKLLNKIDKKILISFIIVITMLSTFAIYKIFATEGLVQIQMSEEGVHALVPDGTWLSLAELDSWYDLFCCEKGTHLPSINNATVRAGGQSSVEGTLTQNDIGKQLFRKTLTQRNSSPYTGGPFTNETFGFYNEKSYTTTPKASYVLTEMINNTGNHSQSYVQIAWWTTKEGNLGADAGENNLSREADIFEEYILEVADVTDADNLNYINTPTEGLLEEKFSRYIENGVTKFKFPEITYEPKWDYEVVGGEDAENITFEEVTTSWDDPEQVYKIGPFSIDYIESHVQVTENGEFIEDRNYQDEELMEWKEELWVQFAGITNSELYTDASSKPLVRKGDPNVENSDTEYDWEFLWLNEEREEEDDLAFPHSKEEFYIKMKYIPRATKITDFIFDFRYMNAGGEYQELTGSYSEASWEAKSKENFEYYYCGAEDCSIRHPRYVSTDYWIELSSLKTKGKSQTLGVGVVAARWYEKASLSMNLEITTEKKAKLIISKQIVDKDGKVLSTVGVNDYFDVQVLLDGQAWWAERVRGNSTVESKYVYWEEGEDAPRYEVREVNMPSGYTQYGEIINGSGTLQDGAEIHVVIKNTIEEQEGYLRINKMVYGEPGNKEFKFKVTIGDKTYEPIISAATNWTWITPEPIKWTGEKGPKYTVSEYQTEGSQLVNILPSTGYIEASGQNDAVVVTAINKITRDEKANIEIIKELTKPSEISGTYTFRIKIDGYDEFYKTITIAPGSTSGRVSINNIAILEDYPNPKYTVEEVAIPTGAKLISITGSDGNLKDGETVTVKAINEPGDTDEKDKSGFLKIDKIAEGNIQDKVFKFEVTINGEKFSVEISAATGWTWKSREYTWKGDNAPTYTVKEVDLPEGTKLKSIVPSSGKLVDTETGNITTVTAVNEEDIQFEEGKIEIVKKLDGNTASSDEFKFRVTIEGYEPYIVNLKAGSTYRSSVITWEKGKPAPKYTIEEIDIPEGAKLKSITGPAGSTVSGNKVTGNLSSGGTVTAIYINELEEKSGNIRVTKEVETDEKMQDEAIDATFNIQVRISGTFEMNGESIVDGTRTLTTTLSAGGVYESPTVKWWGNKAPTYTVTETDIPKGWILEGISGGRGSLSDNGTVEVIVTNSFKTRIIIDLTMEMAGMVWEDEYSDDKPPVLNGKWDEHEKGIDGVEVNIYKVLYSGGNEVNRYLAIGYEGQGNAEMSWPIITQNGGYWGVPRMSVPALTDDEKSAGYKAKYDIEFVYDGQTYEPTTFLPTSSGNAAEYMSASTSKRDEWLKDSMALDHDREEVDNRIAQVYGNSPIDGNGNTEGRVSGDIPINYTSKDYSYGINNTSRKISEVITLDGNGIALPVFKAKARTSEGGLLYPFDDRIHLESYDKYIDELGAVEAYKYSATYEYVKNINLGLVKRETADVSAVKDLYDANVVVNEKLLNYRFNSALAYLAEVTGNEEMAYDILNKQIELEDAGIEYTLGLYKSDYYYRAAMYEENSELYGALNGFYEGILGLPLKTSELDIFLTYKIVLYNESTAYDVTINEIEDYFDSSFTVINTTVNRYIQTANGVTIDGVTEVAKPSTYAVTRQTSSGASNGETGDVQWKVTESNITGSDGTTYNKMSTDSFKGVKLASGERIEIDVTFSVNKSNYLDKDTNVTVENCIMLGAKHNVVEIANYSTYYSKTYHSEKEGTIAGKIDKDSAPSNVNILEFNEKSWYEDDADAAPILNIELYTEDREISGIAWEDMQSDKIENGYGQIVGNGIREDNEYKIGNLTTDLVEKIKVRELNGGSPVSEGGKNVYREYDFIWPTDKAYDFLGGATLEELTGFDSTIVTASAASDGLEEGQYRFISVPAGNYTVRFTYGDKDIETAEYSTVAIYNGQDYKTTTYQVGFESITDSNGDGFPDNEWHDLTNTELFEAKVSDSRDDEVRRLEVIAKSREIVNENGTILETADDLEADHTDLYDYKMTADTAKLNLELENTNKIKDQMLSSGESSLKSNTIDNEYVIGGITIKSIAGKAVISGIEKGTTDFTYLVENIDIGLEERSSTELTLDKQIESISLSTSDNKTILYAKFDIEYELEYDDQTGTSKWKVNSKINTDESFGTENLQALNKDEENGIQNFRYISVDENILQGTTIQIGYVFTILDTGEVDRVGTLQNLTTVQEILDTAKDLANKNSKYTKTPLASEFDIKTMCGETLGTVYYQGTKADGTIDGIVTSKVRQLIDYVDNDAVYKAELNTGVDNSWRNITTKEIAEIKMLNSDIYTTEDGESQIVDKNQVLFETTDEDGDTIRNNIVVSVDNKDDTDEYTNKGFIIDLVPHSAIENGYDRFGYSADMKLTTTRYISQEVDTEDLNFDNIAEVVKYENIVGRRDKEAVPGTADPKNTEGVFSESLKERDTSATELITLTPPTGANSIDVRKIQLLAVTLAGLVIIATGVYVIKKKVLK